MQFLERLGTLNCKENYYIVQMLHTFTLPINSISYYAQTGKEQTRKKGVCEEGEHYMNISLHSTLIFIVHFVAEMIADCLLGKNCIEVCVRD